MKLLPAYTVKTGTKYWERECKENKEENGIINDNIMIEDIGDKPCEKIPLSMQNAKKKRNYGQLQTWNKIGIFYIQKKRKNKAKMCFSCEISIIIFILFPPRLILLCSSEFSSFKYVLCKCNEHE